MLIIRLMWNRCRMVTIMFLVKSSNVQGNHNSLNVSVMVSKTVLQIYV